ncbi:MAG: site-2 protease family protein [Methanosarcinaceae archaeon]|nr:site-2 protease family protein [Methanosarcinaceae archaeon]
MSWNWGLALFIFAVYWMIVIVLDRNGYLEAHNISATGPILMIRTKRFLRTIDRLSKLRSFWRFFGDVGIFLMFVSMLFMTAVILLADYALVSSYLEGSVPAVTQANEVQNLLLIPGLNDFIPFTWGLAALVITLVVHEFSHAIMSRAEDIRVRSMGILYALVPVGGFAEIDEKELFGKTDDENEYPSEQAEGFNDLTATIEEIRAHEAMMKALGEAGKAGQEAAEKDLPEKTDENETAAADPEAGQVPKKATKHQRARILSAGVMANFCTAFVAFVLFFGVVLGCIAPVGNFIITGTADGSAAQAAGLSENMVVTAINGVPLVTPEDFRSATADLSAGDTITLTVSDHGKEKEIRYVIPEGSISVRGGIRILTVTENSPADNGGLKAGMTVISVNGKTITGTDDFVQVMASVLPGDTIELVVYDENAPDLPETITMTVGARPPEYERSYLGITYAGSDQIYGLPGADLSYFNAERYLETLKKIPSMATGTVPEGSEAGRLQTIVAGWFILLSLPFFGLAGEGFTGFNETLACFYQASGDAAFLGAGIFAVANLLLWIGWMNFYVGLFNCIPSLPLDGGHVFRAALQAVFEKLRTEEAKAESLAGKICLLMTAAIVISFAFMIVWPYIGAYFL